MKSYLFVVVVAVVVPLLYSFAWRKEDLKSSNTPRPQCQPRCERECKENRNLLFQRQVSLSLLCSFAGGEVVVVVVAFDVGFVAFEAEAN